MRVVIFAILFALPQVLWNGVSDGYWEIKKITLCFLTGLLILLLPKKLRLPRRWLILVSVVLGIKYLSNFLFHFSDLTVITVLYDLNFSLLALGFFVFLERTNGEKFILQLIEASGWLVCLQTIFMAALLEFEESNAWGFGNTNMQAQYILFNLPFLLEMWRRQKQRRIALLVALNLLSILLLKSRSALFAAVLLLAVFTLYQDEITRRLKSLSRRTVIIAAAGFLSLLVGVPAAIMTFGPTKPSSDSYRLQLYRDTFQLIADHPFGVGVGQFGFTNNPYRTTGKAMSEGRFEYIDQSPHSELLKWPAENGWLFGVIAVVAIVALLRELRRIEASGKFFVWGFVAALSVEVFVQFPFDNPCTIVALALALALAAIWILKSQREALTSLMTWPLKIVAAFLIAVSGLATYSEVTISFDEFKTEENLLLAGMLYPLEWRNHYVLAVRSAQQLRWRDMFCLAARQLRRRPYDQYALLNTVQAKFNIGETRIACQLGAEFYKMFSQHSTAFQVRQFCDKTGISMIGFSGRVNVDEYDRLLAQVDDDYDKHCSFTGFRLRP